MSISRHPFFDEVDRLIKMGKIRSARRLLQRKIETRKDIPSSERVLLSSACRRIDDPETAIRILNPVIRPKVRGLQEEASDSEKCEYAAALIQMFADREALDLLETVDKKTNPQALLFQAFALFSRWNYADAISLLRRYAELTPADSYLHLVGQVNLLDALVYERKLEEANLLQELLIARCERENYNLLHGVILQIAARAKISEKKLNSAARYLIQAASLVEDPEGQDMSYIQKWRAILNLRRAGYSPGVKAELAEVRGRAIRFRDWETLRECDYHLAMTLENHKLMMKVYFGTPFEHYRRRLVAEGGLDPSKLGSFEYDLEPDCRLKGRVRAGRVFDVYSGRVGSYGKLKPGSLPHRLISVLSSDFYRPFSAPALFGELHPESFWNPYSSPLAIRQLIWRARQWLDLNLPDLKIRESQRSYSLAAHGRVTLRVSSSSMAEGSQEALFDRIEDLLRVAPQRGITSRQLSQKLGISVRTVSRYLKPAVAAGQVIQMGQARATRYRLKDV